MTDQTDTSPAAAPADVKPEGVTQAPPAPNPVTESLVQPEVAAPANALIGDANQPAPREVTVQVNQDSVDAQTTGAPAVVPTQVYVHETSVQMDEVITDPNSPLAVQIPDAGRGTLDLPIHQLAGERPEDFFAREASKPAE